MVKPELKDYGLDENGVKQLETRIKKTSDLLDYTIPITFGAILGLAIYVLYYHPFDNPDYFQIAVSFFAFGGFGVLFMGIPMMFFHVFGKFYIRKLKENSQEYNSLVKYKHELGLYYQWNLKNDPDFWEHLDSLGLIYETADLLKKSGYSVLSNKQNEYSKYALVLNRDFKTIPFFFIKSKKPVGIDKVRKLYNELKKNDIDTFAVVCTKGFTKFVNKFIIDKNIFIFTTKTLIDYNNKL